MTPRTIIALGAAQCVNWGVLYYAFGALLLPMQRDLGATQPVVAGAFSAALVVSAFAAPIVGRLCDAGNGPLLLRNGALAAAVLLWVLALVPHVTTLYLVWIGLGLCIAAALYEPAFAIVGRSPAPPSERLRALSAVTIVGGLASTIFLPLTAFLIDRAGWRWTIAALGAFMVASAGLVALVRAPQAQASTTSAAVHERGHEPGRRTAPIRAVAAMFAFASFAGAAFTTTAVAAFVSRGLTPTRAALLAGVVGIMQLPGRIVLMSGRLVNPMPLAAISLMLQAAGLLILAFAPVPVIVAGVGLFAIGNGVMTLARPHLIQSSFELGRAGAHNAAIARAQQIARAIGPFAAASIASSVRYEAMFALLAICLGALAVWCWLSLTAPAREFIEETP